MTNPKAELLPCPFCGGEAKKTYASSSLTLVGCDECKFHIYDGGPGSLPEPISHDRINLRWNTRPAHPETVRMREALKIAMDALHNTGVEVFPNRQGHFKRDAANRANSIILEAEGLLNNMAALSLAPKDAVKADWLPEVQVRAIMDVGSFDQKDIKALCRMALAALDGRE